MPVKRPNKSRIIRRIVDRVLTPPVAEYLLSDNFSTLCRTYDAEDDWREALVRSRDRPDLFGRDTIKIALAHLFSFVLHSRPETFRPFFMATLMAFTGYITTPLPLDDLKRDLVCLGCPENELDTQFSAIRRAEEESLQRRAQCP